MILNLDCRHGLAMLPDNSANARLEAARNAAG